MRTLDLRAREQAVLARDLPLTGPPGGTLPRVQLLELAASDALVPDALVSDALVSGALVSDGSVFPYPGELVGCPGEDDLRALARRMTDSCHARHGSRSYSFPRALVASHDAPVGVDIERVGRCDDAFACSIQTPAERATGSPHGDRDRYLTSLWSSKEALAKALGEPLAYEPRRLEGPGAWPEGRSGPWRARALDLGAGYLGWVCWRAA